MIWSNLTGPKLFSRMSCKYLLLQSAQVHVHCIYYYFREKPFFLLLWIMRSSESPTLLRSPPWIFEASIISLWTPMSSQCYLKYYNIVIVCFPSKTKVIDNMDYIRFSGSSIKLLLMVHSKLSNICLLVIQNICAHLPNAWVRKKGFKTMSLPVSSLALLQVRPSHLVKQRFI